MSNSDGNYTIDIQSDKSTLDIVDTNGRPGVATVTVTLSSELGSPCADQCIQINYMGSANCTVKHNNNPIASPQTCQTDNDGNVILTVTSTRAVEDFQITAAYEADREISKSTHITFTAPAADKIALALSPPSNTMGNVITATATATTKDNVALPGIDIQFTLPGGELENVFFCKANGAPLDDASRQYQQTVTSGDSGAAIVWFTSSIWNAGSIIADLVDSGDAEIKEDEKTFTFAIDPQVRADVYPNLILPKGGTRGRSNDAPADNATPLLVIGQLELGNDDLQGNPVITLNLSGDPHIYFETGAPGRATTIQVKCGQRYDGSPAPTGSFEVATLCDTPTKIPGEAHISAVINNDTYPLGSSNAFSFVDPWGSISGCTLSFPGEVDNFTIYANGRHQAMVIVNFKLTTADGEAIPETALPSVDTLMQRVTLLDYHSGSALTYIEDPDEDDGGDPPPVWTFSGVSNSYSLRNLDQSRAASAILDAATSSLSPDGEATLYYYICCNDVGKTAPPLTLGLSVSPTGKAFTKNAGDWVMGSASPIIYSSEYNKFASPGFCTVTPRAAPVLDQKNIACTGTAISTASQADDGPVLLTARGDYAANFYRQFDYAISISSEFLDQYEIRDVVYAVKNQNQLMNNYLYSSLTQQMYNYNLYLWPTNIPTLSTRGRLMPVNGAYAVSRGNDYGAVVTPGKAANTIYVTRYMSLINPALPISTLQNDINLVASDEYGNEYDFYLPADRAAPRYDPDPAKFTPAFPGQGSLSMAPPAAPANSNYTFENEQTASGPGAPTPSQALATIFYDSGADTTTADNTQYGDFAYQNVSYANTALARFGFSYIGQQPDPVDGNRMFDSTYDFVTNESGCAYHLGHDTSYKTSCLTYAPTRSPGKDLTVGASLFPVWSTGGVAIRLNGPGGNGGVFAAAPADGGDVVLVQTFQRGEKPFIWKPWP